jgi:hypothetical protein
MIFQHLAKGSPSGAVALDLPRQIGCRGVIL